MLMTTHETFLKEVAGRTSEVFSPVLKALLNLPKEELDYWVGQKGELSRRLRIILKPKWQHAAAISLSTSPFFANEEVESQRGYPAAYAGSKPVLEQLIPFARHFKELETKAVLVNSKELPEKPIGAEGPFPFVVPYWRKIAKNYGEAVERILAAIASELRFNNELQGKLGAEYLLQSMLSETAFDMLHAQQKSDYLLVWAQFGMLHARPCRSVRRVRVVYLPHEFGLGIFAAGSMLLSHPERLQSENDLFINLPGDEYSYNADGHFDCAPCFYFSCNRLNLYSFNVVGIVYSRYASASGFLPQ